MQGFDLDFIVYIKTLWERFLKIFKLPVDCIKNSRLGLGMLLSYMTEADPEVPGGKHQLG